MTVIKELRARRDLLAQPGVWCKLPPLVTIATAELRGRLLCPASTR